MRRKTTPTVDVQCPDCLRWVGSRVNNSTGVPMYMVFRHMRYDRAVREWCEGKNKTPAAVREANSSHSLRLSSRRDNIAVPVTQVKKYEKAVNRTGTKFSIRVPDIDSLCPDCKRWVGTRLNGTVRKHLMYARSKHMPEGVTENVQCTGVGKQPARTRQKNAWPRARQRQKGATSEPTEG